jgi:hypothetical protein
VCLLKQLVGLPAFEGSLEMADLTS